MKKGVIIALAIGGGLLLMGGLFVAIGYGASGVAKKVTNEYAVDLEYRSFKIDVSTSDVEFKVSGDGKTKVVCVETDKLIHEVKAENDTLFINAVDKRQWFEKMFTPKIQATVYLPTGTYEELIVDSSTGDLRIPSDFAFDHTTITMSTGDTELSCDINGKTEVKASTGKITLNGMKTESLNLKVSTGDIKLQHVAVTENLNAVASTGDMDFNDVTAENLSVEASTGKVTLKDTVIQKEMTIRTSTGDVRLDHADAETIHIKTSTGDVKGTIRSAHDFHAHASTGKVKVPDTTEGGLCEIETSTGNIEISIEA